MSPFPMLISAGPLRRPTETSPARVVRRTLAASSSLIEACEPWKVTSPNRPTARIRRGPPSPRCGNRRAGVSILGPDAEAAIRQGTGAGHDQGRPRSSRASMSRRKVP
jgi:hypothetical protein